MDTWPLIAVTLGRAPEFQENLKRLKAERLAREAGLKAAANERHQRRCAT
jgi:hypothetical protein